MEFLKKVGLVKTSFKGSLELLLFFYVLPRSVFLNPRFNYDKGFAKPGSKKFCDSGLNDKGFAKPGSKKFCDSGLSIFIFDWCIHMYSSSFSNSITFEKI